MSRVAMTQHDGFLLDGGNSDKLLTTEILSNPLPQWILQMSVTERTGKQNLQSQWISIQVDIE